MLNWERAGAILSLFIPAVWQEHAKSSSPFPQFLWDDCETETHIFVHACLDPELDMSDQPDWLLYWEFFERMQPHKYGKRIVCGHTPQRSGEIKDLGFAVCIDTGPAVGGWLTCLDARSGKYWQANEKGSTRDGGLQERMPIPSE